MKSEHRIYGKETAFCGIGDYHSYGNFRHKSTITATAMTVIEK